MLKSLELFGFKSFADRTLFEFSSGITCVVGPNGSGKSNVVDAIKWILGDQSAKSLRGKEMSDVIFNGSSGRRSSGFAEAILTFDNSKNFLPVDTREVAIGRRLYQSGDSEYLLNGAAVRLKDIRDVFMGTGAGTAAYSIIEQGRVDQILQANPTTRRLVFEEAAGVSKFKSRRIEAERRLERVAQNLLRLTDIVDEVETQLNSTRSQASKAARFREVSTELKDLWTGLAADEFRHFTAELENQDQQLDTLKEQQGAVGKRIEEIESERHETDQVLSEFDDKLIGHERLIANNRQSMATHESTIHHQSTRLNEIELEIHRLREQRAKLLAHLRELDSEFRSAQQGLHEFARGFELSRIALQEQESRVNTIRGHLSQWRSEISNTHVRLKEDENQKAAAIERLAILNSQSESMSANQIDLQEELQTAEQRVQVANASKIKYQQLVKEAELAYHKVQESVQNLQLKRTDLSEQKTLAEQQLLELKERRSADAARLSVLDELEKRQEGIAIGVQEILKRAVTSHFPPWNRVLGLVRDLIDVPMELAPIIDAALGERAQYIATSDLESLLDYLDRGPAPIDGRVGFVDVSKGITKSSPPYPALDSETETIEFTGQPGVYGRADRLIADSEKSPGVAAAVLSDTWIVESLQDARKYVSDLPEGSHVRFVTLQGEVLSPTGELFVGVVPHEASIVSRKSELRQLRNRIHQSDRNIKALIERQSVLGNFISSKHDELTDERQELESKTSYLSECSTKLAGQEKELDRLNLEYQEKLQQVAKLNKRVQQLDEEGQLLHERVKSSDSIADSTRESLSELEAKVIDAEEQLQELSQTMKSQQLEMAKHEAQLKSLQDNQTHIEKEHRQTLRQSEEVNQQFHQAMQARKRGQFAILNAESKIATHALALDMIVRETCEVFLERDRLRVHRKDLSKQEEAEHRQRRDLQDAQHELEISRQNLQNKLTSGGERIFEEFQIPLEQLVSSKASAYRIYLTERYGEDVSTSVCDAPPALHELTVVTDDSEETERETSEEIEDASEEVIVPTFEDVREELEARVDRLRRKIKSMGHVNTEALESLEELENRFNLMNHQLLDLQQAKGSLEDIIRKINVESERIFLETFETIRGHFQELFRKLFGGGDGDIILEDPEDVLECGIDIVARPPGKELRSISLLSGGEKTMTAVGLLFAMFKSKPSPYCILDEVDAALDDANVDRYVTVVKEFVEMTQFIVITHRKRTMTAANLLYGVTMEQAGVSKKISVKFEDVNDSGEIRTAA